MAKKLIALTFDDGPNPPYTNQILKILKKHKVPATFFVCGANIKKYPQLVNQIAKDGHVVGNHSFYHNHPATLFGNIFKEVLETQDLIDKIAPGQPKIFRSPFAASPPWLMRKLIHSGFLIAPTLQAVWGYDWPNVTVQQIVSNVLKKIQNDSIILLHDGDTIRTGIVRSKTVSAVEKLILELKSQGYMFVDLLQIMQKKSFRRIFYP